MLSPYFYRIQWLSILQLNWTNLKIAKHTFCFACACNKSTKNVRLYANLLRKKNFSKGREQKQNTLFSLLCFYEYNIPASTFHRIYDMVDNLCPILKNAHCMRAALTDHFFCLVVFRWLILMRVTFQWNSKIRYIVIHMYIYKNMLCKYGMLVCYTLFTYVSLVRIILESSISHIHFFGGFFFSLCIQLL